jgi:hypothetical protein
MPKLRRKKWPPQIVASPHLRRGNLWPQVKHALNLDADLPCALPPGDPPKNETKPQAETVEETKTNWTSMPGNRILRAENRSVTENLSAGLRTEGNRESKTMDTQSRSDLKQ